MKNKKKFFALLLLLLVSFMPSKAEEPVKFPEQGGWWIDDNRYRVVIRVNRPNDIVEMYSAVDKTILVEVEDSKGQVVYFSSLKIGKNEMYQLPLNNTELGDVTIKIEFISDNVGSK